MLGEGYGKLGSHAPSGEAVTECVASGWARLHKEGVSLDLGDQYAIRLLSARRVLEVARHGLQPTVLERFDRAFGAA